MRTRGWTLAVIGLVVGIAACGGDDSSADDPVPDVATSAPSLQTNPETPTAGGSLTSPPATDAPAAPADTDASPPTDDISGLENPNVCELLTADQVTEVVGVTVQALEQGGACQYDGDGIALGANVRLSADPLRVLDGGASVDSSNQVEDVTGLGDAAITVVNDESAEGFLRIATGPYLVQLSNRNTAELTNLRELADLLLPQLPSPTT